MHTNTVHFALHWWLKRSLWMDGSVAPAQKNMSWKNVSFYSCIPQNEMTSYIWRKRQTIWLLKMIQDYMTFSPLLFSESQSAGQLQFFPASGLRLVPWASGVWHRLGYPSWWCCASFAYVAAFKELLRHWCVSKLFKMRRMSEIGHEFFR